MCPVKLRSLKVGKCLFTSQISSAFIRKPIKINAGMHRDLIISSRSEEKHASKYQQKTQSSLIWIEKNSYYSSKESMDYISDITEIEDVKVVLRHFHQSRSRAARCGSFAGKAFSLLVVSSR
jgi:hypothetical protein